MTGTMRTPAIIGSSCSAPSSTAADEQHLDWIARSFGRADYLPLERRDIELLTRVGEPVSKYPGTHLFKEGEEADSAYLLRSGEVDLYRVSDGTRRVVARVGAGSVLGDIAMFGGGRYISSAQAVGRVRAFRLERDILLPELAHHPAICMRWLVSGLRQLEETQRRVLHLMRKTVLAQVADLLAEESRINGTVALSQAAMATLLGASRQTVNESLARLKQLGAVETGYRRIEILDRAMLAEVAAERRS
jgi:CRP/FNR family transcriptional regulator, cAMP and macrophage regulator